MSKSDKALAETLAKPIESSAERSKKKGNTHPVKPEDRESTLTGHTLAQDNLNAAVSNLKKAEEQVKQVEEANKKLEDDPLYERDLKVLELAKQGNLPGQNIGKAATESEADRAEAELARFEEFEARIKKGDKLSEDEAKEHTKLKELKAKLAKK